MSDLDDAHCAACGADVYSDSVPSVSVVEWVPATRSNVLLAALCADPACMRMWSTQRLLEETLDAVRIAEERPRES